MFKEQNRKHHQQLIVSTKDTIDIWSDAAKKSTSIPDKIKTAGIIEKFKMELQTQKLRANHAIRDLELANRNLNPFKVSIALAKPQAQRGL